ncbi:hypothetical protein MLD38_017319 [Melastoma candidum]|uniref:Uncharacterized protein n=1 Tax=Melastoma candidum TaxID=119954 RepID=A0ACB9QQ90_9MYRT|nr:hypothetical protein MLD38_017319 [Melastoma candidum]
MLCGMSIEKNSNLRGSGFASEFSPVSRESLSTDEDAVEDDVPVKKPGLDFDGGGEEEEEEEDGDDGDGERDEDDGSDEDRDSAAGSDHFDLLELGDSGTEFCQVGHVTCNLPFELYDLEGLEGILSVNVWNEVLSEEERLGLAKYLPDMDQETFMITLKEIFTGCNFHFGSPVKKLFEMLKGGMYEPRVALYKEGLYSFQKRQHYHQLRLHQNAMVKNLCQIRDVWANCKGYSIEEKLRVLNIMKSQKSLMGEKDDVEPDFSGRDDLSEALWNRTAKGRKTLPKAAIKSMYAAAAAYDYPRQSPFLVTEPLSEKLNLKRMMKSGGAKMPSMEALRSGFTSDGDAFNARSDSYSLRAQTKRTKGTRPDKVVALRITEPARDLDIAEDPIYGDSLGTDPSILRNFPPERAEFPKVGKKHVPFRSSEYESDDFMGLPVSSKGDLHVCGKRELLGKSSAMRISPSMLPNMEASFVHARKKFPSENILGYPDEDQMMLVRGRAQPPYLKENQANNNKCGNSIEMQFDGGLRNIREKKGTSKRESRDFRSKHGVDSSTKMNHDNFPAENRGGNYSQEKVRGSIARKGRDETGVSRGKKILDNQEMFESDSFDMLDDEESNPLMGSKLAFPGGFAEVHSSALSKSKKNSKKKGAKESARLFEGIHTYKDEVNPGPHLQGPQEGTFSLKRKKNGKMHAHPSGQRFPNKMSDGYFDGSNDLDISKLYEKNGRFLHEPGDGQEMLPLKSYPEDMKPRQKVGHGDYVADEEDGLGEERQPLMDDELYQPRRKGRNIDSQGRLGRTDTSIVGCNSVSKRRKVKENVVVEDSNKEVGIEFQQIEESNYSNKKQKKKLDPEHITAEKGPPEVASVDNWVADVDMEPEVKPKKKTFTLITPTVHTGFSFSIIHLLSAVRMVMITQLPGDCLAVAKPVGDENENGDEADAAVVAQEDTVMTTLEQAATANVPSLTIQEIVNRVRSNPGDPCILETQEPLYDLVRGVLKIFQSKSAPLGAKGWKTLVVFEKATKSWMWIGPTSPCPSDQDPVKEVTSPEFWALPHKMMVKLVNAFANWLKNSQETLQQIGSLPPPPSALTQCNLDEKERFRDLRAQKSLSTIGPSSDEARDYFRREEVLRYSIPDRAFSYTAADGKKSFVAPLRRCGGKPTSKARDHFMLKKDRPPQVTILCLVRDAAARLPGSIGTRADVCTLIRDSQFVVEDVSDAQVNQVVSGALDRLHYERDPCVQFDSERKLWKYLHREREEEDFEDDGTSSTKKWKRPKKDLTEQSDQGSITVAYQGQEEQAGLDLCSDLIVEPSFPGIGKEGDPMEDDGKKGVEEDVAVNGLAEHETTNHDDQSALWETLDYDPTRETKLLCQENSTDNDFDDNTFGQDRVGVLSTGLL